MVTRVTNRTIAAAPSGTELPVAGRYQPALDGVRAVAVIMVLLFHAGFGWMRAGYLGVSIFFTLSGFLITSLLLRETSAAGSVDMGRFFARRLRRLLPASMLCLILIAVAYMSGEFANVPRFRSQLLGAVLNVYNWVQIGSDSNYGDIVGGAAALTSPLEHYWSLAIEEQFYLIWPFAVVLIARRSLKRDSAHTARFIVGLFLLAAATAPLLALRFGPDFAYWSTPTRFAELLAGAALAAILVRRRSIPGWIGRITLPAIALLVLLAIVLPGASGPAFSGWMSAIAIVSGALVLGLQAPSRVRSVLSIGPLVALGRMSYGVYLFHWPIFVLYRQHGWDLTSPLGFTVAVATTMAVATASYIFLEQVIRTAKWPHRRTIIFSVAAIGVAVTAVLVMPVSRGFLEPNVTALDEAAIDTAEAPIELSSAGPAAPALPPATTITPATTVATAESASSNAAAAKNAHPLAPPTVAGQTTPVEPLAPLSVSLPDPPNRPVRILTVGDSTAFYVGQALAEWAVDNPTYAQSNLLWCQGCGFIVDGTITSWEAEDLVRRSGEIVNDELPEWVQDLSPDVVVLMTTVNDMTNRIWSDEEGILTPFDPLYLERMTAAYEAVTASMLEQGVPQVVWIAPPVPNGYWSVPEMGELDRWEVMSGVLDGISDKYGERVQVVDLDDWTVRAGHADDPDWRPDGTHLTEESALATVDQMLGPLLVRTALDGK